ncbi:hypothetical protein Q4Q35_19775 [Flavivirga aquimarina]|uniref:TonB C-terminal domain-containing protein n=1 Tax=Flavivirga aquimarina TaxID=2027862 RepID=A0ABT8WG01_9FLAO|nr:hypothetical protein [Flavivirga aquimarina]MDO5972046.1 hypothetical protein [Flavivirga aquimarina]
MKIKKMKTKILFFILLIPFSLLAGSWRTYPWTLKTEKNIKVTSIPYRVHNGWDWGITKVYKKNKLLYSIEQYFSPWIDINKSGEYLVSLNFSIKQKSPNNYEVDDQGNKIKNQQYEREAIVVYKNGKKYWSIDFKELKIDPSELKKNYFEFLWHTQNIKLIESPTYIKDNILYVFTIDNKILSFDLSSRKQLASKKLEQNKIEYYLELIPKRKLKIIKKGIPDKFDFPLLSDKNTIGHSLSKLLKAELPDALSKDANMEIWITILINKKGIVKFCSIDARKGENITDGSINLPTEKALNEKIEKWVLKQKFQTKLIPKFTNKFSFQNIIYLKKKNN